MKRMLAFLLSLLMLLSLSVTFASCGGGSTAETSGETDGGSDTTEPETEEVLELPEDIRFDGADFVVLMAGQGMGSSSKFNDFGEENKDYTTVSDAVFKRNKTIESRYGIVISTVEDYDDVGKANGGGKGFLAVAEDYAAGQCSYDLCEVGTMDAATLARNGYLHDLNETPYIKLQKSWWDQDANKDLAIQGRMFYTTGDISSIDNMATHCIFFSKDLAKMKGIDDLYDRVKNGTWTLDAYTGYVKQVSEDLDGNDTRDEKDRYGALIWNDSIQAMYVAARQRICTVGDSGRLALTYYTESAKDVIDTFTSVSFDRNLTYNYVIRSQQNVWDKVRIGMFSNNQALFFGTILNTYVRLRDAQIDYGILPYPLYTEEQERYGSYVGASYSVMVCMEAMMDDETLARDSALVEAIAYESQKTVTPAYYENTLRGRFIRDDESDFCLDIIIGSRCFDVGVYYLVGHYTWDLTEFMKQENASGMESQYMSKQGTALDEIEKINSDFYRQSSEF